MKNQYPPDAYGFAPTDCPLTFNMGSPDIDGGLTVRACHGGKLGLTHMDRLRKADLVPELLAALENVIAAVGQHKGDPESFRQLCNEFRDARAAVEKLKGTP